MKKHLHLYLLFVGFLGFGQVPAPEIHDNSIANYFQFVEKDRIPNGLLLDAAVEFADLKRYDGTLPDSSFTSSKLVADIYSTLITSRLSASAVLPKTADGFLADWKASQRPDIIPLGGLFYKYSEYSAQTRQNMQNGLDPGTIIIAGRAINDKYVDGQWINPYEEKKVFALAPATNGFNKHSFKIALPDNLFLSNQSAQIQKIEYKLQDSQPYQILPQNQLIDVSYPAEGVYTWTFKLTLNSGEILYSHTQFTVKGNMDKYTDTRNPVSRTTNLGQYTKVLVDPVTIPSLFGNPPIQIAKATMYIKLAPGHTQIVKPVIVAEGFDLGIITSPSEEAGLTNIDSFIKSLYGNYSLYSQLGSNYDIVYVDWRNGVDYIQNNAALLKKAIQWVNANKTGTEKNIVLGQSMGGLVARYALKDMETAGQNHDTKLFISHDSPHQGANIPLGLQSMLINVSNSYLRAPLLAGAGELIVPIFNQGVSVNDILTLTDTPAARQMLINYYDKNYNIDNSIHNNWQNELKAKGYPQLTRNVAISNGSECGTDQNLTDLIRIDMETRDRHGINGLIASLLGVAMHDVDMIILSSIPGSSKFVFDFTVRPMTNLNENKQIYSGKMTYKKKILWVLNAQTTFMEGSRNQPSGVFPMDKYGGGRFAFDRTQLPNSIKDNVTITPFSFIPTPSALDVYSGNQVLTENDYQRPYSPVDDAAKVPFANFVAEKVGINADHITFSQRNGDFIVNQLSTNTAVQNQKITSSYLCGTKVLIGGDNVLLCSDEGATYTTGFAPNIQWSVPTGASLVNITGSTILPQISLNAKTNATGYVQLQALLSGNDGSNTISKNIWIGKPQFYISKNTNNAPDILYEVKSSTPMSVTDQGVTQVVWKRMDNGGTRTGLSYMVHPVNYSFDMEITATNRCGSSTTYLSVPAATSPFKLVNETNNSNQYFVHTLQDSAARGLNNTVPAKGNYQIKIANSLGVTVISTTGDRFDLSNLPTGAYFVNIVKDNTVIISQTLIKK